MNFNYLLQLILIIQKKDEVQDSDTIPSFLPPQVYELVKFIFDLDNIKKDLQSLDIDVKKMPLGRLTLNQIKTGYDVLSKIEVLLNNPYIISFF
jgi:poly [ADP-ribose] polymerase